MGMPARGFTSHSRLISPDDESMAHRSAPFDILTKKGEEDRPPIPV